MPQSPILYIFGGLPASGKTTLAKALAKEIGAAYLRIDSIEEAILAHATLVGPEAYEAAYNLAGDNLDIGLSVVADSVNSIEITRASWRQIARDRGVKFHEIEVICSDKSEHRRRLEAREAEGQKVRVLNWEDVLNRKFERWTSSFVIDTACESPEQSCERFKNEILQDLSKV